jgi:hypothetical protein
MGCGDACPYFPGVSYRDWRLPDPAGQPLETVRAIRDGITDRVQALITELLPTATSADEPYPERGITMSRNRCTYTSSVVRTVACPMRPLSLAGLIPPPHRRGVQTAMPRPGLNRRQVETAMQQHRRVGALAIFGQRHPSNRRRISAVPSGTTVPEYVVCSGRKIRTAGMHS